MGNAFCRRPASAQENALDLPGSRDYSSSHTPINAMNLGQRVILCMGCIGICLVWLMPATYTVHADGTRLESNWHWIWDVPLDWSVSVPLTALRLTSVVLCAVLLFFACRTNPASEDKA